MALEGSLPGVSFSKRMQPCEFQQPDSSPVEDMGGKSDTNEGPAVQAPHQQALGQILQRLLRRLASAVAPHELCHRLLYEAKVPLPQVEHHLRRVVIKISI